MIRNVRRDAVPSRLDVQLDGHLLQNSIDQRLDTLFMVTTVFSILLALFHFVGPTPTDLGIHQGQLSPCESPAHCARLEWKQIDPIKSLDELAKVIQQTPRSEIVEQRSNYLHATASSQLFGFVDDLELYADQERSVLQARSVSRLGESDLGVNEQRLRSLEAALSNQE